MTRTVVTACALVLSLVVVCPAPAAAQTTPAQAAYKKAQEARDEAGLRAALADIDAACRQAPKDADNHYVRGLILSGLGDKDGALKAYEAALAVRPRFAEALYNSGVILGEAGRHADALARFDAALEADPRHVDAAYNAGQSYYNQKQFAKALDRWSVAARLTPDDFGIAKKVLQCLVALGRTTEAAAARDKAIALWRSSKDPNVRKLTELVFDQFDAGSWHVYAGETFAPSGAEGEALYTFRVAGPDDRVKGVVVLATSKAAGTPFVLQVRQGSNAPTVARAFNARPAYADLKAAVIQAIAASFPR